MEESMRKLAIVITALLLVAVLGLMLVSVGVVPWPFAAGTTGAQQASSGVFSSKARETSEHTVEIRPKLYVETPHGSIEISGAEVDQIQITMNVEVSAGSTQRAQEVLEQVYLDINTSAAENRLIVRRPKLLQNEQAQADLTILVPVDTELELRSGLGDLEVKQIEGDLKAFTSLGTIAVRNYEGSAHLNTTLGDIHVSASQFTEQLRAISHLGDLVISGSLATTNVLESHLGDARLHLPAEESYVLDGRISLGEIYVGVPFEGQEKENSIQGTIGQGEPRGTISVTLSLGSLRLTN
jgi:hypothetical protein